VTEHALVGFRAIRQLLGVSSNQVYMWYQRRHTTGFPEALAQVHLPQHPGDKRKAPLFDQQEVSEWWADYDPDRNRGAHFAIKRQEKSRRTTRQSRT
jgi:hypothetical protein